MQRDLVEERRWFTAEEYREGLALAQLAPGPLAGQLAMYLGWARGGALGAALVGLAFVLPSFLMVLALAAGYVRFGGLPWMQGAFYGIGAAVIAIIARSAVKLTRLTLGGTGCSGACSPWLRSSPPGPSRRSSGCSSVPGVMRSSARHAPRRTPSRPRARLLPPGAPDRPPRRRLERRALADRLVFHRSRVPSCSAAAWPSCPSSTAAWSRSSAG